MTDLDPRIRKALKDIGYGLLAAFLLGLVAVGMEACFEEMKR